MAVTCATLVRDVRALGVESGDILFIHSSYKSLGPVDGGAGTVVGVLEEAVGPDGLVLMPSFSLVPGDKDLRAAKWDRATTPSTVGWLTEYFRMMPGTARSDHSSASLPSVGAYELAIGHSWLMNTTTCTVPAGIASGVCCCPARSLMAMSRMFPALWAL